MAKYRVAVCRGFHVEDLESDANKVHLMEVKVSPDSWDEVEDAEDEGIFFYTDGEPVVDGMVLDVGKGFVVTEVLFTTFEMGI